jgi:hypothetical protein
VLLTGGYTSIWNEKTTEINLISYKKETINIQTKSNNSLLLWAESVTREITKRTLEFFEFFPLLWKFDRFSTQNCAKNGNFQNNLTGDCNSTHNLLHTFNISHLPPLHTNGTTLGELDSKEQHDSADAGRAARHSRRGGE